MKSNAFFPSLVFCAQSSFTCSWGCVWKPRIRHFIRESQREMTVPDASAQRALYRSSVHDIATQHGGSRLDADNAAHDQDGSGRPSAEASRPALGSGPSAMSSTTMPTCEKSWVLPADKAL